LYRTLCKREKTEKQLRGGSNGKEKKSRRRGNTSTIVGKNGYGGKKGKTDWFEKKTILKPWSFATGNCLGRGNSLGQNSYRTGKKQRGGEATVNRNQTGKGKGEKETGGEDRNTGLWNKGGGLKAVGSERSESEGGEAV